jgi:hypothetical protein
MRLFKLLAVIATLTAAAAAAAPADSVLPTPTSERYFVATLLPVAGAPADAVGVVIFRQPRDVNKVAFLDVTVVNLAPNHSYSFQRATDSTVDDRCTGTNWLTIGSGLDPQAITTDERGFGQAHLFRDLTAIPNGTRFDIHFRVVDPLTSAVVLMSSCHQFVVDP